VKEGKKRGKKGEEKVNQPAMLAVETTTKHRFNPQNPRNMVHPLPSKRVSERERGKITQRRQELLRIQLNDVIITCDSLTSDTNTNEGAWRKAEGRKFYGN
jgi:hypothetical protein